MKVELTVNGFTDIVSFPDAEIAAIHRPILRRIRALAAETDARLVVLLAAPPGAGKSITTAFWAWLSQQDSSTAIQSLAIDGFHYPNSYLQQHSIEREGNTILLKEIKGAPESYDVHALSAALAQLKQKDAVTWPHYDRNIHDPVPDAITVTAPIVIVEGNWVLLDEPNWAALQDMADLCIFLEADEALVKDRLIRRKARGGYPLPEAEAHYERSDKPNIERVLSHRHPADVTLKWHFDKQGKRILCDA